MFRKSSRMTRVMFKLRPLYFCFLIIVKSCVANAEEVHEVDSHSSTAKELAEAKPSISDTKLALDSLDRVLESSKVLRDKLRSLLLSTASNKSGKQKHEGSREVKQHEQVKSTRGSREQMQKDFDRELQSQFSHEGKSSSVQEVVKTAVKEAKSDDTKGVEKDDSIVVPPPPWKMKIKFPPPPPPPHPKLPKKTKGGTSEKKREENQNKKSVSVTEDKKADDSAAKITDKRRLQNSEAQSSKPKPKKIILPPPPVKVDPQRKEHVRGLVSSAMNDASTWGKWTGFSKCHRNLGGNCIQRRQRRCLVKNPTLCAGADKFGVESQVKECRAEKCKARVKTSCVDKEDHFKCRFLAHHGKCDKEPDHMWSVCCGSCQECVDKDANCAKRASVGDCDRFKIYMTKMCPSSCKICNRVR